MSDKTLRLASLLGLTCLSCATLTGRPGAGSQVEADTEQKAAMTRIGEKIDGTIVWSSSRAGNHNLFVMNPDGSGKRQVTHGESVDWFPRFSPDGERILFCRSKKGWVYERDANRNYKWDIWLLDLAGGKEKQVAKDACWGTWIGDQRILFNRATKVFTMDLVSGEDKLLVDSQAEKDLGGADLQQPQLSPDGKCLAMTLRGSRRQTGIFDLEKKSWVQTGEGCQINFHPSGDSIYWVNPSGNGGSEVFSIPVDGCRPEREFEYEQMRFMDIPGRRSHEYFPQMTDDGKWMVWAATRRGHDHDVADYEIYIWQVGSSPEEATRLTFHSGNDRWPDFHPAGM